MKRETFIGLRDFAGWRFYLTPREHPNGSPGYIRTTITPCPLIAEGLRRSAGRLDRIAPELAKAFRKEAECPSEDWVEEQWPIEWLRHGLIKKVPNEG